GRRLGLGPDRCLPVLAGLKDSLAGPKVLVTQLAVELLVPVETAELGACYSLRGAGPIRLEKFDTHDTTSLPDRGKSIRSGHTYNRMGSAQEATESNCARPMLGLRDGSSRPAGHAVAAPFVCNRPLWRKPRCSIGGGSTGASQMP